MESLSNLAPETNILPEEPTKELELRDTMYPEFATATQETTPVSQEQWDEALKWVIGDPSIEGSKGIPHVGPLGLQRKFDFDPTTATAIFEEMQDRGIVTRLLIPTPGKGAVRGAGYDQTRFGGYMVLLNPDGSSKAPDAPGRLPKGPELAEPLEVRKTKLGKLAGKSILGRAATATAQATVGYANLKTFQAKDSLDYISGKRNARDADKGKYSIDRQYAEIFNPGLGLAEEWVGQDGVTRKRTVVTSWMKSAQTKPWERTVPQLEIIQDTRSQAEREVDAQIEVLRAQGESDPSIKTTLLREYHPDREDGGNEEKVRIVTNKFMQRHEPVEEPLNTPKPDIDAIIAESNARQEIAPSPVIESEQEIDIAQPESLKKPEKEAYKAGIAYLAKGPGEGIQGFTRMSPESFTNALTARGVTSEMAQTIYQELQERGYISKQYIKGEGFKVLKSKQDFESILKQIS